MRTVSLSSRSKAVHGLLKLASRDGLIIESSAGERFALTPLKGWVGFTVGDDEEFALEANKTVRNKELIEHLASRRKPVKRVPIADVRRQLGLKPAARI